jgi:leucyl aminopeptidase
VEFNAIFSSPEKIDTDCLVVTVFDNKTLPDETALLNKACKNRISDTLAAGELAAKSGSTFLLTNLTGVAAKRILLLRLGQEKALTATLLREAFIQVADTLLKLPIVSTAYLLPLLTHQTFNTTWLAREATQHMINQNYRFDTFKSEPLPAATLKTVALVLSKKSELTLAEQGIHIGQAIANGMAFTKTLGNLPSNICTPTYLAQSAQALAKKVKQLKVEILEKAALKELGMGAFLSVTQGSAEPPKFIVLHYHGAASAKEKPIVLVGKGITFDSGGISLKPGEGMDEMKYDMCGAGTVLGVFHGLIELKLPLNVVGIIPTCENMPSGTATKPGDIVKSMSGQTIEILNTDAEGRLILCDALTYAQQFHPACVIDIATLTGACIIALGHVASGLFSNTDTLASALLKASEATGDKAWQLPLFDEYQEQLKSNFADMANIGGRPAGSATAASFLARFTKEYAWAHLDIAGTAWKSGTSKGATGRPVPLLIEFLLQESQTPRAKKK